MALSLQNVLKILPNLRHSVLINFVLIKKSVFHFWITYSNVVDFRWK